MNYRDDDEEDETTTFPPTVVVHLIVEKEKDDDKSSGGPRPNAYWQAIREAEEAGIEPDTFGGGYRGVNPAPHGGSITVRPEQVIGSGDDCWCGQPAGHDWPGKDKGRKHPKERRMNTPIKTTVDRRDLRAYHARLQDFVMQCVNEDRLRFRLGKNSVMLYPPDSTGPATVYARNSDRQIRQLQKWYVAHVYPHIAKEEPVAETEVEAVVEELAAMINDPVEHPRPRHEDADLPPEPEPESEEVPIAPPVSRKRDKGVKTAEEAAAAGGEWVPYVTYGGETHERIEMDGLGHYRCRECLGTDHEFNGDSRNGIGGHTRMWHTDRSALYQREIRDKAVETGRLHKTQKQIIDAIETLLLLVPDHYPNPTDVKKLTLKVAELEGRLKGTRRELAEAQGALTAARERPDHSEALAAATKRADDAETKLQLLREALGSLD